MSDLKPESWYQFRLITISTDGYGGWSQPTNPILIQSRPVPPSRPENLTETKSRIYQNHVDITINWSAPKKINFPIEKYQVKKILNNQ